MPDKVFRHLPIRHWRKGFIRFYLLVHFLFLPFNGLAFSLKQAKQEQGFSAPNTWFFEPGKLRRLAPNQERLPEQGAGPTSLQYNLYFPVFILLSTCLFLFIASPKLFLLQSRWQLEGG
ncbi:MAG: hypothetical protein KC422_12405 [Trueperaceae bacterium]|nr:hypothetical protein [Trueperaceae bacterium]